MGGWHFGLIRESRRAFLRNARVELWIPFAYNPLSVVRVPGRAGKYDEVEWPDDDGKQYELASPSLLFTGAADAFFMILPSGAYVNFKTFAHTKNGVTWNMQEALPKPLSGSLPAFNLSCGLRRKDSQRFAQAGTRRIS